MNEHVTAEELVVAWEIIYERGDYVERSDVQRALEAAAKVRESLREEVIKELVHQRDLLGQTLGALLVAMEVVRDTDLTGPELIMAAEEVTEIYRNAASYEGEVEEIVDGSGKVIASIKRWSDDDWKPGDPCGNCDSTNTGWNAVQGGFCRSCGASDSDE